MAVRTDDFTPGDLVVEPGVGHTVVDEIRQASVLHRDVVELEHHGIGFGAVDA